MMAATMVDFLLHFGVLSLFLASMLTPEVLSNDGVCTRNEVVTKTKLHTYYKTFSETYYDGCQYYDDFYVEDRYLCFKRNRISKQNITEEQSYTELETKQECCEGWTSVGCECSSCPLKCKPVCNFTCSNGECTAPNHCECNSGYRKTPETENICEPVCSEECVHGYCTAPNHCECNSGYVKTPGTENICEPVCSQECVHGYCSRPEYCSCDSNYEHNHNISTSNYVCSPVCSPPCINADCVSPDVCSCFEGFAKTLNDPHKCHAQCSLYCHNGVCTSPNECTCFHGYEKKNSTWNVCSPICSEGCINGICTLPEECTCLDGFTKIENICEPVCTRDCVNGECTGPEICSCSHGYESNSEDPYSCFPVCSPECVNGNCTVPNRCECLPGYEETDDPSICRPYCSDGCENGVCSHPEECSCLWGFYSEGNASICTKRGDENFNCAFVSKIVNHNFDRYCFKLTSEIFLKELGNCQILQFLLSKFVEENNKVLDLYCKQVSDLEIIRNGLHLKLECSTKLNDNDQITTESFELETTSRYSNSENEQDRREFEIISYEISSKKTKLSDLPLNLNIIMKFFSLIESSQVTNNYFNNVSYSEEKWCLCHKNQKNWNICASSPLQLHVCSCEPTDPKSLVEDSGIPQFLKTAAKFLMITMAVVLVMYILYRIYESGTYIANGTEGMTTSSEPVLSIDLDSLGGREEEEEEDT